MTRFRPAFETPQVTGKLMYDVAERGIFKSHAMTATWDQCRHPGFCLFALCYMHVCTRSAKAFWSIYGNESTGLYCLLRMHPGLRYSNTPSGSSAIDYSPEGMVDAEMEACRGTPAMPGG